MLDRIIAHERLRNPLSHPLPAIHAVLGGLCTLRVKLRQALLSEILSTKTTEEGDVPQAILPGCTRAICEAVKRATLSACSTALTMQGFAPAHGRKLCSNASAVTSAT